MEIKDNRVKVTKEIEEKMRLLRGYAVPVLEIAKILGVSPHTVTNHTNEKARLRHNERTGDYAKLQRFREKLKKSKKK